MKMARIRIPAIDVDLPIFHGTSDSVLEHGVGHLEGTALPVGGPSTHSVLTGHRGLASAELFTNLDRVDIGDTFTIEVFGEVLTYRVRETLVVEPEDTQSLLVQPGEDLLTLVTCTPLGINTHRILVMGERVIPTPQTDLDAAGDSPDIPGFPWWSIAAGGAILVAGSYVWLAGRPTRAGRAPGETRPSHSSSPTSHRASSSALSSEAAAAASRDVLRPAQVGDNDSAPPVNIR